MSTSVFLKTSKRRAALAPLYADRQMPLAFFVRIGYHADVIKFVKSPLEGVSYEYRFYSAIAEPAS
ncbi:MAG: hypothetical protein FWE67_09690 [Planctomycetaceae bacterium]|nr:hypothetical protein [Planctomycetaceae bacterium]